jgi:hypothetical protein
VCAACSARIAASEARIEVAGQHQHTFFNPAGIVFKIACFATAPGCSGVGPFVQEFSWFPGTHWQVTVCASCAEHLGWNFEGEATFVGLIEDRIREARDA